MRKLLAILMLVCISLGASAQAYVGGTVGIGVEHASADGGSVTNSAFLIAPEAGYYFNPTWAVGASVGVKYQDLGGTGVTTVSVLPYLRGTFAHAGIIDFFGELAMGYEHQSAGGSGVGGFVAALRPGMLINLNDHFALTLRTTLLRYAHYDGVNGIGFALNTNLELGLQYTF